MIAIGLWFEALTITAITIVDGAIMTIELLKALYFPNENNVTNVNNVNNVSKCK